MGYVETKKNIYLTFKRSRNILFTAKNIKDIDSNVARLLEGYENYN